MPSVWIGRSEEEGTYGQGASSLNHPDYFHMKKMLGSKKYIFYINQKICNIFNTII